jgi:6-phosphogluconolactonase (cycloisomerase 2 family)
MTRRWMNLVLSASLVLAGCKGFWTPPSSSSGSGSTTDSSGNVYILNVATNQIAGYYVNSGTLTALPGSPYTVPTTPLAIAIAPNGDFLYVSTSEGIYLYSVSSNGQLSLGNASAPISSDQAISMQISPDDSWLLEVASGAPYVYAISINSSTGVLNSRTEQYAVLPASSVQQVAVAPDESYVFVAMGSDGTAIVPFNGANTDPLGAVRRIATVNSAGAAISVAVDPVISGQTAPRLFYIGETAGVSGSNSGALRAFEFSTLTSGTLTEISGSPFASQGLAPYSILPLASGNYVYTVNRQVSGSSTGVIAGFTVGSTSTAYTLTALGSTFTTGTNPVALAEDSTGNFVFTVDFGGSPDLKGYTFDSTNAGYLDAAISADTGTDPVEASGIAAAP